MRHLTKPTQLSARIRAATLLFPLLVWLAGCGGDAVAGVRLSVLLRVTQNVGAFTEVQTWVRPAASAEFGIVRYQVTGNEDFDTGVTVRGPSAGSVPAGGMLVRVTLVTKAGRTVAESTRVLTATEDTTLTFELPENGDGGLWDAGEESDAGN